MNVSCEACNGYTVTLKENLNGDDNILCNLRKPEHRGYKAEFLIVDDICDDVDKEELKEIIKNAEQKIIDFCGCNLKT